jgi:hypothetical protein
MAFVRAAVKLLLRERSSYNYLSPVLCLGVPEVYVTFEELDRWSRELSGQPAAMSAADAEVTSHPTGQRLGWVSSRTFFKALGFDQVVTVDIPGAEHSPEMLHNLNDSFPASMRGRFRLVLDPGTTEHVFDVKGCFTNIVRALKVDGIVVHQLPIYMYNGGYYSMNPIALHDFYRANGFADIKSYILMWDRYHPYTGRTRVFAYDEAVLGARHALVERDQVRYSPLLLTFARKVEERETILSPLQYEGCYRSGGAEDSDASHWFDRALTTASVSIERSRWHSLRSLKMRFARRLRLQRARRRSFWL